MAAGLIDYLNPHAIELQSDAKTNEEIIRILAGKLEKLGYVKPSYADAVVSRELSMPTGLPLERDDNVAVPHTDPEHVIKAGVAFATLKMPIAFANMEDLEETVPVGYVFLLAINDKDQQIETLQQIMATIQDADALDRLKAACSFEDITTALQ